MTLSLVAEASAAFFLDCDLPVAEPLLESVDTAAAADRPFAGSTSKHGSYVYGAIVRQANRGDNARGTYL
jgi:hypothetical protein